MKKKNNILIVIIIILILLICICIFFIIKRNGISFLKSIYYGDNTVLITDPQKYGQFEDVSGYSTLEIFPQNIQTSVIKDYYYNYQDTIFDPTCQIYLSCTYDDSKYEAELQRLSRISRTYKVKTQNIMYDTENYKYPAYVTIDADNHCYEYALIPGDNQIIYIFLEFIRKENIKFDLQYLPQNYENENTDKRRGNSIYIFYEGNGVGVFAD